MWLNCSYHFIAGNLLLIVFSHHLDPFLQGLPVRLSHPLPRICLHLDGGSNVDLQRVLHGQRPQLRQTLRLREEQSTNVVPDEAAQDSECAIKEGGFLGTESGIVGVEERVYGGDEWANIPTRNVGLRSSVQV
ncbi:hypothetical protein PG997_002387 [Apiospora hydei]|uniref:Uncharacterized protein n=1 Tax=Apiospora hydei TaxID=1337664 RepID=A0ABR1X995_9PEZI